MASTAMATTVHEKLRKLSFRDLLLKFLIDLSERDYSPNFLKLFFSKTVALRAFWISGMGQLKDMKCIPASGYVSSVCLSGESAKKGQH